MRFVGRWVICQSTASWWSFFSTPCVLLKCLCDNIHKASSYTVWLIYCSPFSVLLLHHPPNQTLQFTPASSVLTLLFPGCLHWPPQTIITQGPARLALTTELNDFTSTPNCLFLQRKNALTLSVSLFSSWTFVQHPNVFLTLPSCHPLMTSWFCLRFLPISVCHRAGRLHLPRPPWGQQHTPRSHTHTHTERGQCGGARTV